MKYLIYLILPLLVNAQSPFESTTTQTHLNSTKSKIKCRQVCDKKIYKEKVITDAITFYINSKYYSFNTYSSSK